MFSGTVANKLFALCSNVRLVSLRGDAMTMSRTFRVFMILSFPLCSCWWTHECRRRSRAHHYYIAEKHGASGHPSESGTLFMKVHRISHLLCNFHALSLSAEPI